MTPTTIPKALSVSLRITTVLNCLSLCRKWEFSYPCSTLGRWRWPPTLRPYVWSGHAVYSGIQLHYKHSLCRLPWSLKRDWYKDRSHSRLRIGRRGKSNQDFHLPILQGLQQIPLYLPTYLPSGYSTSRPSNRQQDDFWFFQSVAAWLCYRVTAPHFSATLLRLKSSRRPFQWLGIFGKADLEELIIG